MASNATEMVTHVKKWDSILNEFKNQELPLDQNQTLDLATLITLNQAVLDYLTQLQGTDNAILQAHFHNCPTFEKSNHIENHLQNLKSVLDFLNVPAEPNTTAFKDREKLLLNLATIVMGLMMAAMGLYFFWLLPLKFIVDLSIMLMMTFCLMSTPGERTAFSMFAVFCASLDAFNTINSVSGFSAFTMALLASPYMPLAIFPLVGLATCYLIDSARYKIYFQPQYAVAFKLNNDSKRGDRLDRIKDSSMARFFSDKPILTNKINQAYQEYENKLSCN